MQTALPREQPERHQFIVVSLVTAHTLTATEMARLANSFPQASLHAGAKLLDFNSFFWHFPASG